MRFILVFLLSATMLTSVHSQVVNKSQWTLVHERTADWCPYCGGWGWDFKESILSNFANRNVLFLAVHHSGGLQTPTSTTFTENFGGVSQPVFFEGSNNMGVNSSNMVKSLEELGAIVEYNDLVPPYAGVGVLAQLDDQKNLRVDASIEVLENIPNGNFYFGLYLVEDIMHSQTGKSGIVLHENVLTKSFFTEDFGKFVGTAPLQKGQTFNFTANLSNVQGKVEDLKVAGIIWSKVDNVKYHFFNGNLVSVSKISATDDITTAFKINGYQSESGALKVEVQTKKVLNNPTLSVVDVSGKVLETLAISKIDVGSQTFGLRKEFSQGLVYITLTSGGERVTKALVVE